MLATNDIFHLSGYVFLAMAALVWMTRPKRGAKASAGH
jgi:DHA2 family multidrug resistance protein